MKQRSLFLGVFVGAIVIAACGSGAVESVSETSVPSPDSSVTQAPSGTSGSDATPATTSATTSAVTVTETAPPPSDRPVAPDFILALGNGGSFTLSEGDKPVYLVFWAEW